MIRASIGANRCQYYCLGWVTSCRAYKGGACVHCRHQASCKAVFRVKCFFLGVFEALCTCEHKWKDTKCLIGGEQQVIAVYKVVSSLMPKLWNIICAQGSLVTFHSRFLKITVWNFTVWFFTEGLLVSEKNATLWAEIWWEMHFILRACEGPSLVTCSALSTEQVTDVWAA